MRYGQKVPDRWWAACKVMSLDGIRVMDISRASFRSYTPLDRDNELLLVLNERFGFDGDDYSKVAVLRWGLSDDIEDNIRKVEFGLCGEVFDAYSTLASYEEQAARLSFETGFLEGIDVECVIVLMCRDDDRFLRKLLECGAAYVDAPSMEGPIRPVPDASRHVISADGDCFPSKQRQRLVAQLAWSVESLDIREELVRLIKQKKRDNNGRLRDELVDDCSNWSVVPRLLLGSIEIQTFAGELNYPKTSWIASWAERQLPSWQQEAFAVREHWRRLIERNEWGGIRKFVASGYDEAVGRKLLGTVDAGKMLEQGISVEDVFA